MKLEAGFLALILLASAVPSLLRAEIPSKRITAARVATPPSIDGNLNEAEWQTASPVLDFTQFDPVEGAMPTEVTSVRVLYDDRAVYVGAICYDAHPELIVRQLSRRDRSTEAEKFTVLIDSYNDRQTAFVFGVNVSGVQSDGILTQAGTQYDNTWDEVWEAKPRVYRDGWSVEFAIPLNALRFSVEPGDTLRWGINFRRYISRKRELNEWVMVPRTEQLQIPFWGTLYGIAAIDPPMHLDLAPYVSASTQWWSNATGRASSSDVEGLAGLDARYGLARNVTLNATINPDFGQVEVDEAVLNLTVFETLYPEKRPFFVEGAQFFSFGTGIDNTSLPVFFSRRIGRRPGGSVAVPAGGVLVENPQVTTILGAAKLSGRTASGLALGALSALTAEEHAVVRDSLGNSNSIMTEPRASYNVLRVQKDFDDGSHVGGIATIVGKDLHRPAYSGGIDWNYRFGRGTHTLDGYVAAAHSSSGTRPGGAGRALISRISADHWTYTGSYSFATRTFDINDIGFFSQPHDHGGYAQVVYRENFGEGIARRYGVSIVPEARWNWDGVRTLGMLDVTPYAELRNFWKVVLQFLWSFPAYDDAERGIIGLYRRPSGQAATLQVTSDSREPVWGSLALRYEGDSRGKQGYFGRLTLSIRPVSWIELSPEVLVQSVRGEETGVFSGGGIATVDAGGLERSLFADRNLDQVDLSLRGILTFSRTLSLQVYLQTLLPRGAYDGYRALVGPSEFQPLSSPPVPGYDFNDIYLNAHVLLRWEYLPGSTAYLVWTQTRYQGSADASVGVMDRFGDFGSADQDNVLLVKLTYWFSL